MEFTPNEMLVLQDIFTEDTHFQIEDEGSGIVNHVVLSDKLYKVWDGYVVSLRSDLRGETHEGRFQDLATAASVLLNWRGGN